MSKPKIAGISTGVILLAIILGWMFTAPYLSNQGLGRLPGVIIGGTATSAPDDFSYLNDIPGPMKMKQAGFPELVVHLSFVGTQSGVISATRPDNGYWGERVKERGGDGWLRVGDQTFEMTATQVVDDNERLAMMEQWAAKSGRTLDEPLYTGSEPLREWEVYLWTPRS
ncbi:MAG: hypothetical protein ACJATW_002107 [Glaciecola sp.]|jgi:hypothetical protein